VKVALLTSGVPPNPTSSGGTVTAWTIMTHLLDLGHEVFVCALTDPEQYDPASRTWEERTQLVRDSGAEFVNVQSEAADYFCGLPRDLPARLLRARQPPDAELFPTLVDREAMRNAVVQTGAEVAFVYHHDALASSIDLPIARFAALGDPPHLSALYRFRERLPDPRALRGIVALQARARHQPRVLVRLLEECAAAGAFAAHHSAWLRTRGVVGCEYLRTPVPDPGPVERREADRPRILLVGHMKGVVTLEGLRSFARRILPVLERELGADTFEVRIAGGYEPPDELRKALDRPSVRMLGHVEDMAAELRTATAMLAPNSIPLGIRVRIITAFSHGTCVVSHRANTLGIPELRHEQNSLIAASPEGLARQTLRAIRDRDLREHVGDGARTTYEETFHPRVSVGRIAETLDRIRGVTRRAVSASVP
jgi:glycosyltransferase involved in cell wall biosynthesis